jgi:hypothetical protein
VRHLGSLALSAVGGLLLYLGLGLGTLRLDRAAERLADGTRSGSLDLVVGLGLVLLAAAVLWLLLGIRFSPVGPALLGAGLATLGVLAVVAPTRLGRVVPAELFGVDGVRAAPPSALLLVALPMLGTVLSKRRWRGSRADQPYSDHPIDTQG